VHRVALSIVVIAVITSLAVGGIAGFFLGMASTHAGKTSIRSTLEEEKTAEVSHPKKLIREVFELQYPSNWHVDADDKDYDPDYSFSIHSPGNAFVMFDLGAGEAEPEDILQIQLRQFEKVMSNPAMDRFERYGRLTGRGATLKGMIMGSKTIVKLFAFGQDGLTIMIAQSCPDDDLERVQDGLSLIESTFTLRTNNKVSPVKRNAADAQ
jgi:hypothetical protein